MVSRPRAGSAVMAGVDWVPECSGLSSIAPMGPVADAGGWVRAWGLFNWESVGMAAFRSPRSG